MKRKTKQNKREKVRKMRSYIPEIAPSIDRELDERLQSLQDLSARNEVQWQALVYAP